MKLDLIRTVSDRNIARSPVARTVWREQCRSTLRKFQALLYMMEDGEVATEEISSAAYMLAVTMRAMETAGRVDEPSYRVMQGGVSSLQFMYARGDRWRVASAVSVDVALTKMYEVFSVLTPDAVVAAIASLKNEYGK